MRKQYSKVREQELGSSKRQASIQSPTAQPSTAQPEHPAPEIDGEEDLSEHDLAGKAIVAVEQVNSEQSRANNRTPTLPSDGGFREENKKIDSSKGRTQDKHQRPKTVPFRREAREAEQGRADKKARRQAKEEANRQRQEKLQERERFRKAMAKARTRGPHGQRKLGRESAVLLEKVQRMVGK